MNSNSQAWPEVAEAINGRFFSEVLDDLEHEGFKVRLHDSYLEIVMTYEPDILLSRFIKVIAEVVSFRTGIKIANVCAVVDDDKEEITIIAAKAGHSITLASS